MNQGFNEVQSGECRALSSNLFCAGHDSHFKLTCQARLGSLNCSGNAVAP